jgi:hypothetical protein
VFKREQDLRRAVALRGKHRELRQGCRVVLAEAEIQHGAEARRSCCHSARPLARQPSPGREAPPFHRAANQAASSSISASVSPLAALVISAA